MEAHKLALDDLAKRESENVQSLLDKQRIAWEQNDKAVRELQDTHINNGFAEWGALNSQLEDRLGEKEFELAAIKDENFQFKSRIQDWWLHIDELEEQLSKTAADASEKEAVISDLRSQLRNDVATPPTSQPPHRAASKRTSTSAFSPDRSGSKRQASMAVGCSVATSVPTNTQVTDQVPSRPAPSMPDPPSSLSTRSPKDVLSVECVQIDVLKAMADSWTDDISLQLRQLVRDLLVWTTGRNSHFAEPKELISDLANVPCLWHQYSRNQREKTCARAPGHACSSCGKRKLLCAILESRNNLMLLPLHPSVR